jgi:WD40 repeat protein
VTYTLEIVGVLTKTGLTSTSYTLTGAEALANGTYSWRVRVVDGAGNTSVSITWTLTVDTTPPTGTLLPTTSPNANGWYKTDVVFTFTAADTLSGPAPLPPDITLTTEGAGQTVSGTIYDLAGNSTLLTSPAVNIDKTAPPAPTLVSPLNGARTNDNTPTFAWTSVTDSMSGGVTYTLEIIGVLTKTGLTSTSYTLTGAEALADGTYSWHVQAVDGAGNTGVSTTWTLTVSPPAYIWSNTTGVGVFSVSISSDGSYIANGNDDKKVYLFSSADNTPLWTYKTGGNVKSVAISSDGSYIVAGSDDYKVYLFSRADNTPLWSYKTGGDVKSVAISSDGSYIAAGSNDDKVYLFSKVSSTPLWSYKTGGDVKSVAISSDGSYIAAGGADKKVYLFSKVSSTPLWSYTTAGTVNSVAISSDGSYIAAGGADKKVYLFSKVSSTPLWSYTTAGTVNSVAISSDGSYITAGGDDKKVYLFSKVSSTPLWSYTTVGKVKSVAISADGSYITAGTDSKKVYLFGL